MASGRRQGAGQATVEMLVAVPLVLIAGLTVLQLLAVGQGRLQVEAAAEAGAVAIAVDGDPELAVRSALPASVRGSTRVVSEGGRVLVDMPVLAPLALIGIHTRISAIAWAMEPEGTE